MQLSDQLRALEAAQGDQGALARAAVDLAYLNLSEVQRLALKDALDAAAVPHWFDETILAAVLDVSLDDASSRLTRLRILRSVERFQARGETALNVHEAARLALRGRLAETAPDRFRTLSANAYRCFAHDLSPAGRVEWIFHLLSADPERGASELEALSRDWYSCARPEDLDALTAALKELEDTGMVRGRARAWTLLVIAWTRACRGESAQLRDLANEALQLAEAAADLSAKADAKYLLGDVLKAQGQLEAAQAAFAESLAISRRLAEQDPSNAGWQRELAVAHSPRKRVANQSAGNTAHTKHMKNDLREDFLDAVLRGRIEARIGRVHTNQRLGMESEYEARVFSPGSSFFHLENWYSVHSVIRNSLRAVGLYGRGKRNTHDIRLIENDLPIAKLPQDFAGFRILHISDLHVDMNQEAMHVLCERVRDIEYDICVLTGNYRAKTFGPYAETLEGMRQVRNHLGGNVYGILGNHDTIRMLPGLEDMDIRMLVNESVALQREDATIYLAGIDDAHYFRVHNIEKAAQNIPANAVSILLSHTPETFRQAAHAEFDALLCGDTHGGQICLPGEFPIMWDAQCPRYMASGNWTYLGMKGYTTVGAGASIVAVRLNCPPEIVLHRLRCT